jgi:hypothetical protein
MAKRPGWLTDPILDQLDGRPVGDLTTRAAESIIKGLAILQEVRAPIIALPVLIAAAALDTLGIAAGWAAAMWKLAITAVLVLPWYGVLLGAMHVILRRSRLLAC